MKSFILALALLLTGSSFAAGLMGEEAVEIAGVLTHPQVKACLKDIRIDDMVNVSIDKLVARCPMCNTYTITGHKLIGGDVPDARPTVIQLIGRGERSNFGFGFVQTFKCEISQPELN